MFPFPTLSSGSTLFFLACFYFSRLFHPFQPLLVLSFPVIFIHYTFKLYFPALSTRCLFLFCSPTPPPVGCFSVAFPTLFTRTFLFFQRFLPVERYNLLSPSPFLLVAIYLPQILTGFICMLSAEAAMSVIVSEIGLNIATAHMKLGRRGGLVVSALDSGSRGPGSSPGQVTVCCVLEFTLTVPLSTQEYKWVPANCQGNLTKCWEVTCDGLASNPGGEVILLVASCYRNRDKQ